jgi:hypothetical protein
MEFTIAKYRRHITLAAKIVSSLALLGATGGLRVLARLGDVAIESYDRTVSDWARNTLERLNPTFPRCF